MDTVATDATIVNETDSVAERLHAVPDSLRARAQWVCWRYVVRDDKQTKCPFNPNTGAMAKTTDTSTWGTFDEALSAFDAGGYEGVGYVFSADDPCCGIDLDDCIEAGTEKPKAWAQAIIDECNSYSEISPSLTGVKIFTEGKKPGPKCRKAYDDGEVEIYDHDRFFCVTGLALPGTPNTVNNAQHAIEHIYSKVFAPPPAPVKSVTAFSLDDEQIIDKARSSKSGAKFNGLFSGGLNGHRSQSEADSALVFMLAFYTKDARQIDRIFRRSGLFREKWDERHGQKTYGEITIENALSQVTAQYEPRASRVTRSADAQAPDDGAPCILLGTDEHRVADEVEKALGAEPEIYHRGGVLVRVVRDGDRNDSVSRPEGTPTITLATLPWLRERITRRAQLRTVKLNREGEREELPAHPPQWLPAALLARGSWQSLRRLYAISDAPILRPDGSIHQTPGYDQQTGVLFDPAARFPQIPDDIGLDDADAAQARLMDVFGDFRFEAEEHRGAVMAALLTPLARHAFRGPAPLFLFDANVRGAGKGLCAQCTAEIILGRSMPVCGYVHDSAELAKRITSIAIAADAMVLLDNLAGNFGNDALDRALTAERWRDRILGVSQMVDLPLVTTWFATGNNVLVGADTARRIIHIRLDVLTEHPEERADFQHPDLLGWVRQNRPTLLVDALTILSAYLKAGRPDQRLTPYGSFEGWSAVVRSAVVWCGLPDPCLTRARLNEMADTAHDALTQMVDAAQQYDPHNLGFVVSEIVSRLYAREFPPIDPPSVAMRSALEALVGSPPGKPPMVRAIGNRLRSFRRRVVSDRYLDIDHSRRNSAGATWRVFSANNGGEQ